MTAVTKPENIVIQVIIYQRERKICGDVRKKCFLAANTGSFRPHPLTPSPIGEGEKWRLFCVRGGLHLLPWERVAESRVRCERSFPLLSLQNLLQIFGGI
jgi:hypothetical protein